MRFSIWPSSAHPWDETLELARHCEATGWEGVWFADHFMPNTGPDGGPADGPMLECWSVLAGLAAATERVRIGPLVTGNTYRHPAVLANVAAAVDQISHGRLVLGLGAGWQVNEHRAYGIELPSVRDRLDRLEEAAQIVLGLLRAPRTTVAGKHYRVTDAPNEPKPVQPRLPLLIGGRGERRTMRIAARYADEWNAWTAPEEMAHKRDVLRRHCDDIGRDPAEIKISTQAFVFLSDDERWLAEQTPPIPGFPTVAGNAGQVAEAMERYRAVGVDEFIVPDWMMGPLEQRKGTYDRLMAEVIPQIA
jgi:F420-dependent oxidoreductase-like protein